MKKVWLWERENERPCLIAVGSRPRGPGRVYEIQALTAKGARDVLRLAQEPEPKQEQRALHAKWEELQGRIRLVEKEEYGD